VTDTGPFVFWSTGVFGGAVYRSDKTLGTTVTMAAGQSDPSTVAADVGNRYVAFTDFASSVVLLCPSTRCPDAGPGVVAAGQSEPAALTFGPTSDGGVPDLYWVTKTDPGTVAGRAASLGSPVVTLATGQHAPSGIAVDEEHVYWTSDPADASQGAIYACARTGCQGSPTLIIGGQSAPHGIAVDAQYIYWTNATNPGGVFKIAKPRG
jgi:hypothetical protein